MAPKIKILRIIARLNTGGPAVHTILLTRGLNGTRFSSRLVTGLVSAGEGDMEYYASRMNVVPLVLPELGSQIAFGRDLRALVRLYRIMRAERPDIIHTHTTKAGVLGRLAGLLYNCTARLERRSPAKLVHTFHGHLFHGYFRPLWSRILVLGERLLARLTHRIITVSESVRNDLVVRYRVCPTDKVVVVPLGLDFGWVSAPGEGRADLREEFKIPPNAVTIGIVGRLTEIKNHELLLSAMRMVADRRVKTMILGDGELRSRLERMVLDLGLEGSTIFTGWQLDPAKIYGGLDIVCLTSRNEGTPAVLIEAMAAGKPFVSTRVGGVPDLMVGTGTRHDDGFEVFANGILVPADDPAVLAAALRYLAHQPERRQRMGAVGQETALMRFSHERLLGEMKTIYASLLGRTDGVDSCDR